MQRINLVYSTLSTFGLLLLVIGPATPATATPLADGLIAHYKLDTAGDPIIDSAGSLDGTNDGATLIAANDPSFGNALEFDGAGDRLNFNQSIHTGTGDFSIFAWVKTPIGLADGLQHTIIDYGTVYGYAAPANLNEELYLLMDASGVLKFSLRANPVAPTSTTLINDGLWHSVGVIHTGGNIQLYVDGNADGSALMSPNIAAGDAAIGGNTTSVPDGNNVKDYWIGGIDDVGVWSRALTTNEIAFVSSNPVPEPSTAVLVGIGLVGLAAKRRQS